MGVSKTRKIKAKKAILTNPSYRGTEEKFRLLLAEYAKTGHLTRACQTVGIDHSTHYRRLQSDPGYRSALEEAEQNVAQNLEDRVYEMAVDDRELQAAVVLLKRFRPDLYRERASLDVNANVSIVEMLNEARSRIITLKPDETVDRTGTEG